MDKVNRKRIRVVVVQIEEKEDTANKSERRQRKPSEWIEKPERLREDNERRSLKRENESEAEREERRRKGCQKMQKWRETNYWKRRPGKLLP